MKRWVLVTTVGVFIGAIAGSFAGVAAATSVTDLKTNPALFVGTLGGTHAASIGGVVGLAQWLVLRGPFRSTHWWMPATVLGLGLGGFAAPLAFSWLLVQNAKSNVLVATVVIYGGAPILTFALVATTGILTGLTVGAFQSVVLWRRRPEVVGWIAVNAAFWGILKVAEFVLTLVVKDAGLSSTAIGTIFAFLFGPLSGLALGLATGIIISSHLKGRPVDLQAPGLQSREH